MILEDVDDGRAGLFDGAAVNGRGRKAFGQDGSPAPSRPTRRIVRVIPVAVPVAQDGAKQVMMDRVRRRMAH
jgi:hypothetical protein